MAGDSRKGGWLNDSMMVMGWDLVEVPPYADRNFRGLNSLPMPQDEHPNFLISLLRCEQRGTARVRHKSCQKPNITESDSSLPGVTWLGSMDIMARGSLKSLASLALLHDPWTALEASQ